jgi:type III secretion protein J
MSPSRCLLAVLLAFIAGCSVPVAADLQENDANRIIVALEAGGIGAQKQNDPANDGRWQVMVARADTSTAVRVMQSEGLPPPESPGVLEALGEPSLVPSRTSERAKLIAGTAGELERSLRAVDGVLSARVHLAVPVRDAWSQQPASKGEGPTAAVLLRYRGAQAPLSADDVRRLVAGAVPGLSPDRVSVVATTAAPPPPDSPALSHFGPLAVTRSSLTPLRVLVGVAAGLNLLLIVVVLLLWIRMRRNHAAVGGVRSATAAAGQDGH